MQIWTPTLTLPGTYTIAGLPAATDNQGRYAFTTDLFGGPGDYCISDGTYWKPVRPFQTQTRTAADMTFQPLLNAPTQIITGTIGLGVTFNYTLGTTNAYPGARCLLSRKATGTGTLLTSLGLGLLSGAWILYEFDGNSWQTTATGGLL